jgi:hypothetical protein
LDIRYFQLLQHKTAILKIYMGEGVVSEVFEIRIHKGSVLCLYPDTISCFSAAWVLVIRTSAALF